MPRILRLSIERQFMDIVDDAYADIARDVIRWARGRSRITLSQMVSRYQDALARSVGYWK